MHLKLSPDLQANPMAQAAATSIGKCVHCGFCNAACPTYRLLGNELDGPRGRIYLMKGLLEGAPVTAATQLHLDRCLTCRACETACPSGVDYGHLLETGRALALAKAPRAPQARWVRAVLRGVLTRPWLFGALLRVGQWLRPLLPLALREKVPAKLASSLPAQGAPGTRVGKSPASSGAQRRVLLLSGCVQPALAPGIHRATLRVLAALGIGVEVPAAAGCCGAMRQHLDDAPGALTEARHNIDAWSPWLESVEAIITNASGCGVQLKDYGRLLRDDPVYGARAARVAALARDLAEVVAPEATRLAALLRPSPDRLAFQAPCTLQHGQRLRGVVEGLLLQLGAVLLPCADSTLCCGSAGTYSLLQPKLSAELRHRKLAALHQGAPQAIVSANIGCIAHLGYASRVPVQHWVEWVEGRLAS